MLYRDCIASAICSDWWVTMDTASGPGVRGTSFRVILQSIKIIVIIQGLAASLISESDSFAHPWGIVLLTATIYLRMGFQKLPSFQGNNTNATTSVYAKNKGLKASVIYSTSKSISNRSLFHPIGM